MLDLTNAEVYDIEVLPNVFTFDMVKFNSDERAVWEISEFRDDRYYLLQHFEELARYQIPMIGFNTLGYDYPIIHMLWKNPNITFQQFYQKSQEIITSFSNFGHQIWASDRFAPQIDLYKMHHFDNKAKATGLKTLQINMRSPTVVESTLPFDRNITAQEINEQLIPYGSHDTQETKRFAHFSKSAIDFRLNLIEKFGIDVMNWNDTRIGEQTMIKLLGDELCYDRSSGKRKTKQTIRNSIALNDIIFDYIKFDTPEFNRILSYFRTQILRSDEFAGNEDGEPTIKTKGIFAGLTANVGGVEYHYGVGGIHGSIKSRRVIATEEYPIIDIDVEGLYPNIAIKNGLYPEHLGQRFVEVYKTIPDERKEWQAKKGKKCTEANALKLAANGGTYGKSNSSFSPMYDPQYMIQTTINGQLLLSMLIEKLNTVPTLQVIQANTDGVTYQIHKSYEPAVAQLCKEWEALTRLTLERVEYEKMFIRDVNNYVAVAKDGSVKLKGAYWTPNPLDYHGSIASAQPPAWHKNFSNVVSVRAAVAHMVHGVDLESFIRLSTNPYDFCCAVKVNKTDKLLWGDVEQQRNTRFHISTTGAGLVKRMPPEGPLGHFKKAPKISDAEYAKVMQETAGAWDVRVCTKNQSRYGIRENAIMAGYGVQVCNNINDFDWSSLDYKWYLQEAQKLVI
jgi:hypothetical protein